MSRADADRNLLFGVFALNHHFVSSGALVAALDAWIEDKGRSLADILVEHGAMPASRRSLLQPLIDEHIARHGGDPARSLASLSSLGTARSALESIDDPDVRATLASLGPFDPGETNVEDFDPGATTAEDFDPGATTVEEADDPGSAFAGFAGAGPAGGHRRFRILRLLAKGGLGEVFLAEDAELRREVALKEIREQYADDPQSRARFVLEAEITGNLEHPGIVPIYGLGHYPDGRPFYAMRFIKGDNLAVAIAKFHGRKVSADDPGARAIAFRGLLGRFIDVCEVMTYAHIKGVLHRDLKPENVMLGRYGQTIVVDWGLAKAAGVSGPEHDPDERPVAPSSASGTAETLPGSVLGTPCYMSPEQARGELDALGPPSDIYSLGATLYTLLTGHRAFDEPERDDLLRKVRAGDFPTPRRIRPELPKPLEAICLKAMARWPEDRYRSARALAVDVERWLAGEPVSAWPEPISVRARRWIGRHRTLVASAIVAAVVLVLAGGALWTQAAVQGAREEERTAALADRIATAGPSALPAFVQQAASLRPRIVAPLRAILDAEPEGRARWNAAVALAPSDPEIADDVLARGRSDAIAAADLRALRAAAEDLGDHFSDRLWQVVEQPPVASSWGDWARAATIAEAFGPDDPRWNRAAGAIIARLSDDVPAADRRALILALGLLPGPVVGPDARAAMTPGLLDRYRDDPDPGVHGAIAWLLRRWGRAEDLDAANRALEADGLRADRRWFVAGDGQTFTVLPGDRTFAMGTVAEQAGSEAPYEPRHLRRIARPFAIAATEVTWARYRRFLEDRGHEHPLIDQQGRAPGDDAPAISVSWIMAARYCNWLSDREGLPRFYPDALDPEAPPDDPTDRPGYRLPTEGEWEFACRAGSETLRPFGDGDSLLDLHAWWSGNSADAAHPDGRARPVGSTVPNRWGLFDLLGNAVEWCQDPYRSYPPDPGVAVDDPWTGGAAVPLTRIVRGGHFASPAPAVRSGLREYYDPQVVNSAFGFRVARTLDPAFMQSYRHDSHSRVVVVRPPHPAFGHPLPRTRGRGLNHALSPSFPGERAGVRGAATRSGIEIATADPFFEEIE